MRRRFSAALFLRGYDRRGRRVLFPLQYRGRNRRRTIAIFRK